MKSISFFVSSSLVAITINAAVLPTIQTNSQWFKDGAQTLVEKTQLENKKKAKNVIIFLGDGMGISTLTAARIYQGQQRQTHDGGEENFLSFEKFPNTALVKTYNTNQQTSDSSGTMSAIMTGVKTKAGVVSVSDASLRSDCLSSKGNELITLVDLANAKGLSTGVVTTARITHATPASTYSSTPERNWEADSDLSTEAITNECQDIAYQLVMRDEANALTVALGGGRHNFIPDTMTDGEHQQGKRKDGMDLTKAWT